MQAVLVEDENGLDISLEKNDKAAQIDEKTEKQRHPRSFTIASLFIILFVSFAATGWLYIGKMALAQVRNKLLNENRAVLASLDAMGQKAKFFENEITKLQSQNKTLENQHKTLVNQSQTLKTQNEALANNNDAFTAQNQEFTTKVSVLTDQLDKASRVYRQRIAELQAKIDRLTAENAALLDKTRPRRAKSTPLRRKKPIIVLQGLHPKNLLRLSSRWWSMGNCP